MLTTLRVIFSHFFRKGKKESRWRDVKTGRFTKTPRFFRFTWGCKGIPVHGNYVSFAYYFWGTEKPDGEGNLLAYMEEWLDFPMEEWWFNYVVGFGQIEVEYDEELDGTEEFEP